MTSTAPDPLPIEDASALVLAPYAERLTTGKRVVVLGDATTGLARELAKRGARLVHVYDPDASRAAQATLATPLRNVAYAPFADDLGVRDGAFDVAIIPDLSLFPQPPAVLARARQLAQGGVLVVVTSATEAPGRLGYYELYDHLALVHREVRMLGQVPFAGYAIVDFSAEGDLDVSVDTSLADASEPKWFVAVASDRPLPLDAYTIVQAPGVPASDEDVRTLRKSIDEERLAIAEVTARLEMARIEIDAAREARRGLEAKNAEAERRVVELTETLDEARQQAAGITHRVADTTHRAERVEAENAKLQKRIDELEAAARQRAAEVQKARRAEADAEAVRTARAIADLEEQLRQSASREDAAAKQIGALRADLRVAEQKLAESQTKLADAQQHVTRAQRLEGAVAKSSELEGQIKALAAELAAEQEAHAAQVVNAEQQLVERSREIASLRQEVEHRGALVRELLDALESVRGPVAVKAAAAS